MTKKPNCSTCNWNEKSSCLYWREVYDTNFEDKISTKRLRDISYEYGLMCHLDAREYLMAPVIKELKRLRIEHLNETGTDNAFVFCSTAITLIRDGVK